MMYCFIIEVVFMAGFVYLVGKVIADIPIDGYLPFLICCVPLGFSLIWGARLWKAAQDWRMDRAYREYLRHQRDLARAAGQDLP